VPVAAARPRWRPELGIRPPLLYRWAHAERVPKAPKTGRTPKGSLTECEREALRLFASCEGLLLDPVYTGRAAAGMIDLIRTRFFKTNETVLFLHTGGQPALFAEQYADEFK
jgi:hypothetical protein